MYTLMDTSGDFWVNEQIPKDLPGSRLEIGPPKEGPDTADPRFIVVRIFDGTNYGHTYFRELRFRIGPIWSAVGKTDQWAVVHLDIRTVDLTGDLVAGHPIMTNEQLQELIPVLQHYCQRVINRLINSFVFGL